jgi:hypothetical protein
VLDKRTLFTLSSNSYKNDQSLSPSYHNQLNIFFSSDLLGDADPLKVIKVAARDGRTGEDIQLHYSNYKVAGNGSFGVVYQAKLLRTGEDVAIKKVLQDKRFKVRHVNFRVGLGSSKPNSLRRDKHR